MKRLNKDIKSSKKGSIEKKTGGTTKPPKKSLLVNSKKNMNLYSSLAYRRKVNRDRQAKKKAEDLATLPKEPIKRFLAHLHPKRVVKFWFSWSGVKFIFKFVAASFLIMIIMVGGLFLYFKKDLDEIRLSELRVTGTVNTYLDRNGELLWEDKGSGDYRLVVDGSEISTYMRQATVAIEDKNFYTHPGVDLLALVRAGVYTVTGKGVQGGSTLTQQLIKQVYFSDEAKNRSLSGLPRKIKEAILSLEIEKMYNKEQIITMYLNESPYGGRRNGVESGAQTYFGKKAKDLNLAESALLASVPNNPAVLNPYNQAGHERLIARQQKTLDAMVEMGYITADQATEAKKVPILDQIKTESSQYRDIKAPHFVLEIKKQLEAKYGVKTMRAGGFKIKTTLDLRAQKIAEEAVAAGRKLTYLNNSNNIALSSVDVETGQVIAMVGSVDFNAPGFGQSNAATALLEPGSTIKPVLDYLPLFEQREGQNFGPGTVLNDENIDWLYCRGYSGACRLRNFSGAFYGNITLRSSLAGSLNIGAVKALYINGIDKSLKKLHELGDVSYCKDEGGAGLSMAIGSGCRVRQVEHANTYASIARGGVYKPLSYVLEVKNSAGITLEKWADAPGKKVVDEQAAYLVADILGDANSRAFIFGWQARDFGFMIPGVWTGSKTGTTTTSNSAITKDSWIMSFSPVVATGVWNGNDRGYGLSSSTNNIVRRVVHDYMDGVHKRVYGPDGKWRENQKMIRPSGIQELVVNGKKDLWPSWYNSKTSGREKIEKEFNKYNKKLAKICTPNSQKITVEVEKIIDPLTKKESWIIPAPYTDKEEDDCNYREAEVSLIKKGGKLVGRVKLGSEEAEGYQLLIGDTVKETGEVKASGDIFLETSLSSLEESKAIFRITTKSGNSFESKLKN